jgi:preprotein translocase subunit SecG
MKIFFCLFLGLILLLSLLRAENDKEGQDNQKSSSLTVNAPRPTNMANPEKPGWLPQRHGK